MAPSGYDDKERPQAQGCGSEATANVGGEGMGSHQNSLDCRRLREGPCDLCLTHATDSAGG